MPQIHQDTYVEREMRRRRIEANYRRKRKIIEFIQSFALVAIAEAVLIILFFC